MSSRISLGIDCRFSSFTAGLGTYTRSVVPEVVRHIDASTTVFVRSISEAWIPQLPATTNVIAVDIPHYSFREQWQLPLVFLRAGIQFLYSPTFAVPLYCPVPFVSTVHDLILHAFPNHASLLKRYAYFILMKHSVHHAQSLITVSDFTKSTVLDEYGHSLQSNIHVVTEGVDAQFQYVDQNTANVVLQHYNLPHSFFLYVGSAKQHKNVQMLIDAHHSLHDVAPLVLVCSGREAASLTLHDGVIILSDVPNHHLPALYSSAIAFVTPSLYEGFCLPLLEARACHCPIIASRCTAIPEVAGSHALLIEPTIDAFQTALRNPPRNFSPLDDSHDWQKVGKEIAGILSQSIMDSGVVV